MKNIAIVGNMYAGKTTLANALVKGHGYTRVSMAGPLKEIARQAYGEVVEKDKEYPTIDRKTGDIVFKSGREIYQGIGQSLKYVDRDIWLRMFIAETGKLHDRWYVVDDVRFAFEADYLRSQGWLIVRVQTPEETRVKRAFDATGRLPTDSELHHESEVEVDSIVVDMNVHGDRPIEEIPSIATYLAES